MHQRQDSWGGLDFKEPNDALAERLLGEQLEDGGWNCEAWPFLPAKRPPSRRSSFHTTICVLEGLLEYERAGRKSAAVTKARKRGERYLLERGMFRSQRSGRSSTSAGCGLRIRHFGITMFCADWTIYVRRESKRTGACGRLSRL